MDGEAQVTTSEPANTAPPLAAETTTDTENVSHESSQQEHSNKPSGFDPVDIPTELKPRFDRVYGNMKRYEAQLKQTKDDNKQLMAAFEALQNDQKQIINHLNTSDYKDNETRLTAERQAAWDKADIIGFNKANDALLEIKARKIVSEAIPKQQPEEQIKPNGYMNGKRMPVADAVNMAVENGEIDVQDATIFKAWESQVDDGGMKMRGWTDPAHPLNQAAAIEGRAVFENPAFKNKPFAEKLREIDRRMGLQTQTSQNNSVLGSGNLTRGNRQPKVDLSPQIEKMAIRTKFAANNPKLTPQQKAALKDSDHVEAYRQVMIRNLTKGGR